MKDVGSIMNTTIVPFGNARFKAGKLECQHGADECVANSYEQCAIDVYPDFATHFPFYQCVEGKIDSGEKIAKQAEQCAKQASLDISKIEACVGDKKRAADLQQKFSKMTPADHTYVPWIVVDGTLSKSQGDKLAAEVCKAYKGTKPAGCAKALAAADTDHVVAKCDA